MLPTLARCVHRTDTLELVLAGGRVLRVPPGFDPASLRQLLRLLEELPC
jgi:hypothetical protein